MFIPMTQTPPPLFPSPVETRIGRLDFDAGYPAPDTTARLFDELDFQRAVQGYLWAVPYVSFGQWQHEHETVFGATDGDLVHYRTFRDKLGLLTSNATTPYIIGFLNLDRTGPVVLDVPPGPTAGMILDFWQRPVADLGLTGPDAGLGGRYVLVGPGQDDPGLEGALSIAVPTVNVFHGIRILTTDEGEAAETLAGYRAYPADRRDNPPPTRVISPEGRTWSGTQPRGLAYWEMLARLVGEEPVHERDRIMLAMLEHVGIRKGHGPRHRL